MNKTKLDKKKFSNLFGDWWPKIEKFFNDGGLDPIYSFLKSESGKGKKIAPSSSNTYRTFLETPLEELKAVIIFPEPYCEFVNNNPIASGVALDCSITTRVQPLLVNFYRGIEREMFDGLNLNYIDTYDLSYLSSHGILLLSAAFTVEKDNPKSHSAIWEPFTKFLLTEIISSTGVPILFLGDTQKFAPLVEKTNYVYQLPIPGISWNTKNTFTQISRNIWDSNKESILWLNIDAPF